jgi:uncharacterized protein (TIGR02646 family)
MRPIERGPAPKIYTQYKDASKDMKTRLGMYCSYCERYLPTGLAVEHIVPKVSSPALINVWTNFLLSCSNCNSVKGTSSITITNFLWPDRDNTLLAFVYSKGGFMQLSSNMNNTQKDMAQRLLDLVGLDRHKAPGWNKPAKEDERWQQREEVWATAERCRDIFISSHQSDETKYLVLEVAKGKGFFSVWMTVFDNYPSIKIELIQSFTGTATVCFDLGVVLSREKNILP